MTGGLLKRISAALIVILFFISAYPDIFDKIRTDGPALGYEALKKEYNLLKAHPEYRNFMFRPSDRTIIDFNSKAPGDTVTVLVLKVEFQEDTSSLTTGNGKMDYRGSMDSMFYYDDSLQEMVRNLYYQPPHDSLYFYNQMLALQNYYLDDSHGKLFVDFDIFPKGLQATYTVPHTMVYYGDENDIVSGMFTLMRDALKEAEMAGGIDFSHYDAVIVFHAGSMWQTDMLYDTPYDLPAVYITGADYVFGEPVTVGGKSFNDCIIYSETANQDGAYAFLQGGLAHEFGHQLGLYDLYDTRGYTMGMGGWALMGTGNWNMSGLVPPHHAGYNAYTGYNANPNGNYSNWIYFNQTLEINADTEDVHLKYLGANEDSSYKLVKIPINEKEYYIIENRNAYISPDTLTDNPDSNGFRVWKDGILVSVNDYDVSLPLDLNAGGLAIYHIDQTIVDADSGMNEINGYDIKGIDMEEADRVQDFEMSFYDITNVDYVFYGNPNDVFFRHGVNDQFSPKTLPDTRANNGGQSHIYIYDISEPDTVMTFSVLFDYRMDGFPFAMNTLPDVNSPAVFEDDTMKVIFFQTMEGEIYAVHTDGTPAYNASGVVGTFNSDNESYSTPAFGHIRSSSSDEIVVTSYAGDVNVLRMDTLSSRGIFVPVQGSPFTAGDGVVASPVIYDIDYDSLDEIIIVSEDMYLHVLEFDGTLTEHPSFPVYTGSETWALPVVADNMIFVLGADGVLRAYDFNGNLVFKTDTENILYTSSSPVIADYDGDGQNEALFIRGDGTFISADASNGKIEIMKELGIQPFYSSPVIGDVNGDGAFETVLIAGGTLFVLDRNGIILNNYPVQIDYEYYVLSTPVLADINADSIPDILYTTNDGRIEVITKGVSPGFPIQIGQSTASSICMSDLNDNGKLDVIAVGDSYLWAFELNSAPVEYNWPSMHLNNRNNRYYAFEPYIESAQGIIISGSNTYIYPNPVEEHLTLRFETGEQGEFDIRIFDSAGKLKITETGIDAHEGINEQYIDVSELAAGFYILRLELRTASDTAVKLFKFVVRR